MGFVVKQTVETAPVGFRLALALDFTLTAIVICTREAVFASLF
jgi:hypothetical protein